MGTPVVLDFGLSFSIMTGMFAGFYPALFFHLFNP